MVKIFAVNKLISKTMKHPEIVLVISVTEIIVL